MNFAKKILDSVIGSETVSAFSYTGVSCTSCKWRKQNGDWVFKKACRYWYRGRLQGSWLSSKGCYI